MNSLSWFLYFVDVADSAKGLAVIAIFAAPALVGLAMGACKMGRDVSYGESEKKWEDRGAAVSCISIKTILITWAVALPIFIAVPSKSTMFAIAASEIGEKVAASEAVQGVANDATRALQQWIKKQIEPEAKK